MEKRWIVGMIMMFAFVFAAGCQKENDVAQGIATDGQQPPLTGAIEGSDSTPLPDVPMETKDGFSLSEVSRHSTEDNCWLAIDGKVYDVSSFVGDHPGGESILQGCGTDATELFLTRPMGSGTPHSARAEAMLENYFIGMLDG